MFPPGIEKSWQIIWFTFWCNFRQNLWPTGVEKSWQTIWLTFWCNFHKYLWMRLKKIKYHCSYRSWKCWQIIWFTLWCNYRKYLLNEEFHCYHPGLKRVDKLFCSVYDICCQLFSTPLVTMIFYLFLTSFKDICESCYHELNYYYNGIIW